LLAQTPNYSSRHSNGMVEQRLALVQVQMEMGALSTARKWASSSFKG